MKRRKYTETPAGRMSQIQTLKGVACSRLKPPRPVATYAFTRPVLQRLNAPCVK